MLAISRVPWVFAFTSLLLIFFKNNFLSANVVCSHTYMVDGQDVAHLPKSCHGVFYANEFFS